MPLTSHSHSYNLIRGLWVYGFAFSMFPVFWTVCSEDLVYPQGTCSCSIVWNLTLLGEREVPNGCHGQTGALENPSHSLRKSSRALSERQIAELWMEMGAGDQGPINE